MKGRFETMIAEELRASGLAWACRINASTALTHWILEFERVESGRQERFVVLVEPEEFDDEDCRARIQDGLRATPSNSN